MKKDKHILINICDDDYKKIEFLALKDDRTISSIARRLILKNLNDEFLKVASLGGSEFIKIK